MIQIQSGEPKGSLLAYLMPEKTHKGDLGQGLIPEACVEGRTGGAMEKEGAELCGYGLRWARRHLQHSHPF